MVLPYNLQNGQDIDAVQLMANFNAVPQADLSNVKYFIISGTTTPYAVDIYDIGDTGLLANSYHHITLPAHIGNAAIGQAVAVVDPGGQAVSGPNTAGFAASFAIYKAGWPNGPQGEIDGIVVAVSNNDGDQNVLSLNGKCSGQGSSAIFEGGMGQYDTTSTLLTSIDVQAGVINLVGTAKTVVGFAASVSEGTGLSAFYASYAGTSDWTNWFDFNSATTSYTMTTGGDTTWLNLGVGGGAMTLKFKDPDTDTAPGLVIGSAAGDLVAFKPTGFVEIYSNLKAAGGVIAGPFTVATLPSAITSGQMLVFCIDAPSVNAGAGFLVDCDGSKWASVALPSVTIRAS